MLVSFTQTYGDNRHELLDIYFRDKKLIEFKNKFDINFYSFHNSSAETVEYFKSKNQVKNTEILRYNNCSYGDCVRSLLKILDKVDCSHLFFTQDDTFSADNNLFDFDMFLDFVRSKKEDFMVCMSYSYEEKIEKGQVKPLKKRIYKVYSNSILEATTLDYLPPTWNMSDDPYIASIDLVKNCYDENYLSSEHIWEGEAYLKDRFIEEKMTRHMFEKPLFRNYNIIGHNISNGENDKRILIKKGLMERNSRLL